MPKKYNKDKEFDIRKMVKLVNSRSELMNAYLDLYGKYKDKLNYHYNEFILSFMFLFMVEKSNKLAMEYDKINVVESDPTKVLSENDAPKIANGSSEDSDAVMEWTKKAISESKIMTSEEKDRFYSMVKGEIEKHIKETTTSASSGAYSTPFAWSKSGKTDMTPVFKGGTKVKVSEQNDINDKKTQSVARAQAIGKQNAKNTSDDFSKHTSFKDAFEEGSYKKYLEFSKDSQKEEDAKARRITQDENDGISKNRGGGMQHIELDLPNKEWEGRRDTDLGKEMAEEAEEVRKYRKAAKDAGYPKVTVPVRMSEAIDRIVAELDARLSSKSNKSYINGKAEK